MAIQLLVTSTESLDSFAQLCLSQGIRCYISRVWADNTEPWAYQLVVERTAHSLLLVIKYSDQFTVRDFEL